MSRIFTRTAAARNLRLKRMRPFRPQTNSKAEAVQQDPAGRSGPTNDRTTRTASGSTRCLGSLRTTITGVHTAASAGLIPPPGCKQRPWDLQLAPADYTFAASNASKMSACGSGNRRSSCGRRKRSVASRTGFPVVSPTAQA